MSWEIKLLSLLTWKQSLETPWSAMCNNKGPLTLQWHNHPIRGDDLRRTPRVMMAMGV
uniref:Uncharacterized protein n=1 Tax=Anguilla anguilla TaxID=7936 RepID=A0A0E9VP72_ANGAN